MPVAAVLSESDLACRLAQFHAPLFRIATEALGIDAAEDCLQEAALRAFTIRTQFDNAAFPSEGTRPLYLWLLAILRFQIADTLRRKAACREVSLPPEAVFALLESPDAAPLEALKWEYQRATLARRIASLTLTPLQRFCVVQWLAGQSLRSIGEACDPPVSKSAVYQVIGRVKAHLKQLDSSEDDAFILECIENLPAARVYQVPLGVWDRKGTAREREKRRHHIVRSLWANQECIGYAIDVIGSSGIGEVRSIGKLRDGRRWISRRRCHESHTPGCEAVSTQSRRRGGSRGRAAQAHS